MPGGVSLERDDADRAAILSDGERGVSDNVVGTAVHRCPLLDVVSRRDVDHKPLVLLLSSKKNLDELSSRIQRFRMRLMR